MAMTHLPNRREATLNLEIGRLRAELTSALGWAATRSIEHEREIATSDSRNFDLMRENAVLLEDERRHTILLTELNHRARNILATVQGLAALTLKATGDDPRRFVEHFNARLQTLARAHDLLTDNGWEAAGLDQTLQKALAPWLDMGERFRIDVPSGCAGIKVSPRQAQALVLALHELATNASKYGALSNDVGIVGISCEPQSGGAVVINWNETGGPPVTKPIDRRGFGTRLLERGLAQDLGRGSSVDLHFDLTGMRAVIHFTPARVV